MTGQTGHSALIWELRVPHTEVKGAFCLEAVQVVLGTGEWRGGRNLGWLRGGDRGSARLGWGWRLAMMSKLGLEGCDLCCQLGDVLLSGHGGVLAQGLQGLSFLLLSGHIHAAGPSQSTGWRRNKRKCMGSTSESPTCCEFNKVSGC